MDGWAKTYNCHCPLRGGQRRVAFIPLERFLGFLGQWVGSWFGPQDLWTGWIYCKQMESEGVWSEEKRSKSHGHTNHYFERLEVWYAKSIGTWQSSSKLHNSNWMFFSQCGPFFCGILFPVFIVIWIAAFTLGRDRFCVLTWYSKPVGKGKNWKMASSEKDFVDWWLLQL